MTGLAPNERSAGFTLIELLAAMAVAAILVAMAVTTYGSAMIKTHRTAAKGCLAEAAQAMERHYSGTFTYVGAALPGCSTDVTDHYVLGFAPGEPTDTTFKIQAVPQGRQASSDTTCGTLSLDSTGVKGAGDGSASAMDACW